MDPAAHLLIENWTVDYGGGHVESVCVPHAWRQGVPVAFEGPVIYRTEIEVPKKASMLRFYGVSYSAEVAIDGNPVASHKGIWDAFDVSLQEYLGKRIELTVTVVKNGGPSFPVKEVASGFLPYVFHTFGGIHGEVELLDMATGRPEQAAQRVRLDGPNLYVDGKPFFMRGVLHWGWYPELGHTNPSEAAIRAEVLAAKGLGFNLIKFCLWIPPHRYLRVLREEGVEAWVELPLWDPSSDPLSLEEIASEIERIVRQYRHHDNIVCWTIGCELSSATSSEYRERLVNLVKSLTGSPLVKDNSGGAEMYGGDLREFGDFEDFHPYCDLPFYPPVLDSLQPGSRPSSATLLGEFNDIDVHRDIARVADDMPFWASGLSELNAKGVRWQHDLPKFLPENRFAQEPTKHKHRDLMESSRRKAIFARKFVNEAVRSRGAISGYVVTGLRDTPISSAGFFDDWGRPRFTATECRNWNGPDVLFKIPVRRPPWIDGGNRPGWLDTFNYFAGQIFFRIGVHSEKGSKGGLIWSIFDSDDAVVARGALPGCEVPSLTPCQVGEISWHCESPGSYRLSVEFGNAANEWPFNVFAPWNSEEFPDWGIAEERRLLEDIKLTGKKHVVSTKEGTITFLLDDGTLPMPFWREAAYEFGNNSWGLAGNWERLLSISPDRALDPRQLPDGYETIINRIDTRTYREHPIAVRSGKRIITTLRPFGGLGIQPIGITRNPSGSELLREMIRTL